MSHFPEPNPDQLPHLPKTAITPSTHTVPPARFSHGVRKGNILQVAGQVGFGPAVEGRPPAPVGPTLREQTLQTLENVRAVLEAGGATWEDAVMIRAYLTDTGHFAEFNEVWNGYFADLVQPPAARTTVYVGLPQGLLVEIDALAVLG
ncbi:RidA family protein [Actinacidiphila yeochonensis]|uniref:RidA family protein n=1 Tax=Actinacidiphila yeochonensis TaxID=89050 RepID=UPI00068BBDB3|nr:RidA family protein [Actinacidiphila yeochonensis]